jgi:hypothetical protein
MASSPQQKPSLFELSKKFDCGGNENPNAKRQEGEKQAMNLIRPYERVYITQDISNTPYVKGDVGVVAHIHYDGRAVEVEFFAIDGTTLSVETLPIGQVRSCEGIKSVPHILGRAA